MNCRHVSIMTIMCIKTVIVISLVNLVTYLSSCININLFWIVWLCSWDWIFITPYLIPMNILLGLHFPLFLSCYIIISLLWFFFALHFYYFCSTSILSLFCDIGLSSYIFMYSDIYVNRFLKIINIHHIQANKYVT